MKKIILKIAVITGLIFTLSGIVHAENICDDPAKALNVDECLLPRPGKSAGTIGAYEDIKLEDIKAVGNLPEVSIENIFITVIQRILEVSMFLTIIAIVIASIYYIISRGNEEEISKAKNIIIYLIIGIAIMSAAYAIVAGIAQFQFF